MVEKLSLLKSRVKSWSKVKLKREQEILTKSEIDLENFYRQKNIGISNEVLEQHGRQMEIDRNKFYWMKTRVGGRKAGQSG